MVNCKIFYSQTVKQPLPSVKCFTSKLMKYKTFYTSLSHNSPSPPFSLSLSPLSLLHNNPSSLSLSSSLFLQTKATKPLITLKFIGTTHLPHHSLLTQPQPLSTPTSNYQFNRFFFFFSIQSFNSLSSITGSTSTSTVLNSPTDSQISIFLPLCGFINLGFWLMVGGK